MSSKLIALFGVIALLVCSCSNNIPPAKPIPEIASAFYGLMYDQNTQSFTDKGGLPTVILDFYKMRFDENDEGLVNADEPWSPANCFDSGMMTIRNAHGDTIATYTPPDSTKNQVCIVVFNHKRNEYLVVHRQCAFKSACYIDHFKLEDTASGAKIVSVSSAMAYSEIRDLKDLAKTFHENDYLVIGGKGTDALL
jgi:hypothetical protein